LTEGNVTLATESADDNWLRALQQLNHILPRLCAALESSNSPELVSELIAQLRRLQLNQFLLEREMYSTREVAAMLNLSNFTVREGCRLKRIRAKRAVNRRGGFGDWRIPKDEVRRILDEGLPPPPDKF
jgi:hypothetical protein